MIDEKQKLKEEAERLGYPSPLFSDFGSDYTSTIIANEAEYTLSRFKLTSETDYVISKIICKHCNHPYIIRRCGTFHEAYEFLFKLLEEETKWYTY